MIICMKLENNHRRGVQRNRGQSPLLVDGWLESAIANLLHTLLLGNRLDEDVDDVDDDIACLAFISLKRLGLLGNRSISCPLFNQISSGSTISNPAPQICEPTSPVTR